MNYSAMHCFRLQSQKPPFIGFFPGSCAVPDAKYILYLFNPHKTILMNTGEETEVQGGLID